MEICTKIEYGHKSWNESAKLKHLPDNAFDLKWWEIIIVTFFPTAFIVLVITLLAIIWS